MQSKGHIVITVVSIFNTELDSKSLNSVPWFPFLLILNSELSQTLTPVCYVQIVKLLIFKTNQVN